MNLIVFCLFQEHDVLRIKFLGDCYYCVSGIPMPNIQHAKCCVDLGLEMIHIIKDVRFVFNHNYYYITYINQNITTIA